MKLAFVDFETQGDDPRTTNITEVGAILVETSGDRGALANIVETYNTFCFSSEYPAQTQKIIDITGITDEDMASGIHPREALLNLKKMIVQADYILAHKKTFDQVVFESNCVKYSIPITKARWLCTLTEIPYSERYRCKQLSHLALDHGLKLDHRAFHRALDDVQLLADLVLGHYSMHEIIEYANTPWVYVKAVVPKPWDDGGKGKEAAKAAGYGWEKARGTEQPVFQTTWVKRLKQDKLDAERKQVPFPLEVLHVERTTPESADVC